MGYNVLIAEDDESIVEVLTLYLNSNGLNVISANDGEAAIELLRHRKTDIVFICCLAVCISCADIQHTKRTLCESIEGSG